MEQTIEVLTGIPTPKPKYETGSNGRAKARSNQEGEAAGLRAIAPGAGEFGDVDERSSRRETFKTKPSPVLIGVELELERVLKLTDIPKNWIIVVDNSLKLQGLEFTCLMSHTKAMDNILALYKTIDFITSSRCSTHVHVNILDLTYKQLKTLLVLYTIFERYLFEISGRRYNSNYCVPVQHTYKRLLYTNGSPLDLANLYPKYSAIHAFAQDEKKGTTIGTLEFRHAKASADPQVLVDWINTVVALKQSCMTINHEELIASLYEMRSTSEYLNLFNSVFGEDPRTNNISKFKRDIEYGITFVKLATQGIV